MAARSLNALHKPIPYFLMPNAYVDGGDLERNLYANPKNKFFEYFRPSPVPTAAPGWQ